MTAVLPARHRRCFYTSTRSNTACSGSRICWATGSGRCRRRSNCTAALPSTASSMRSMRHRNESSPAHCPFGQCTGRFFCRFPAGAQTALSISRAERHCSAPYQKSPGMESPPLARSMPCSIASLALRTLSLKAAIIR